MEVRCRGEEGMTVRLDPDAIGRALLNLMTNAMDACKEKAYGPGEKPLVDIEVRKTPGELLFIIRDNGIGMGDEVKQRLFTRFFSTKEGKGTGLGLSVSKKAVEEHGGKIQVDSVEGKGSTFVISLPDPDTGPSSRKTS
jgi:signal transduction histidine kinase